MKYFTIIIALIFSFQISAQATNLADFINDGTTNVSTCDDAYFLNNENEQKCRLSLKNSCQNPLLFLWSIYHKLQQYIKQIKKNCAKGNFEWKLNLHH